MSVRVQCKSSRWQMLFKIGVRPETLLQKNPTQVLSYEICEIFKNTFFLQNTSTLMAASHSKHFNPIKKYKWYTWTVLLSLVFLDNEYSSEVSQTLLVVSRYSNIAQKSQKQSSRVVLEKRCFSKSHEPKVFSCEFCKIFKNTFFHRTPPVGASKKLKAEAVFQRYSVKKVFLKISQTKDVFLWIFGNFQKHFFHRTPPVAVSKKLKAEAVFQRYSVKTVFLKISQTKDVFLWIFGNFQKHFFHRTPPVAVSKKLKAEVVVQRFSVKKVFLKISQTKDVFLWIMQKFQEHLIS